MSVKIKLVRVGAKGRPSYRVVVADERTSTAGKTIEILGHYDPMLEPSSFTVDKDKVLEWMKKGAVPTFTVRKMLGKIGVLKKIDFTNYKKKSPKQKGAPVAEAPAQAAPKPAKESKPKEKVEAPKSEEPKAEATK